MRRLRLFALLLCLPALPVRAADAAPPPPNIILIVADDLGWTDAAFAGSRFYETPHLDALAAGGIRLSSFYGLLMGVPTRAAILSGLYGPRTGVLTSPGAIPPDAPYPKLVPPPSRESLPPGTVTLPAVLRDAGYATAHVGKWDLGADNENHPSTRGFSEALVTSDRHTGFETQPPSEIPPGAYLADFITDRAIEFISRHPDKPFFLHVAHLAVHAPIEAKPSLIARFEKKPPMGGHRDAAYAAMIASLDESVGRIMATLAEKDLDDRTVVIFTSDNGGAGGYVDPDNTGRRIGVTDNSPLRGGKGMLYEGGIRVPFLVRWPGVTQPGSRCAQPAMHIDLFPTVCEIAGTRPPQGHPLDGVSLVPILRDASAHLGRDALYWHYPDYLPAPGRPGWSATPAGMIRAGNFKLIEFLEDGRLELYNLAEDLGEKNNLVRSLPDRTTELRQKLAAWRKELNAPMPTPNPAPAPVSPPAPANRARP